MKVQKLSKLMLAAMLFSAAGFTGCDPTEPIDNGENGTTINEKLAGKVKSINGDSILYANGNAVGINQMVYDYETGEGTRKDVMFNGDGISIKGGTIGGNADYHVQYIDFGDARFDYEYDNNNHLSEIRYLLNYSEYPFVSNYTWNANGDLAYIEGDQQNVSRMGLLETTFEYTDMEYTKGNFDLAFYLASGEYYAGTWYIYFDGNIGDRSVHLISKRIQDMEDYDKYDMEVTYRYEFNTAGYVTKVFETVKWDAVEEGESLILEFEYY
jgi:hypothetical protein